MSILLDIDKLNEKSQEFYDEIFNFRKDNMDLMKLLVQNIQKHI